MSNAADVLLAIKTLTSAMIAIDDIEELMSRDDLTLDDVLAIMNETDATIDRLDADD